MRARPGSEREANLVEAHPGHAGEPQAREGEPAPEPSASERERASVSTCVDIRRQDRTASAQLSRRRWGLATSRSTALRPAIDAVPWYETRGERLHGLPELGCCPPTAWTDLDAAEQHDRLQLAVGAIASLGQRGASPRPSGTASPRRTPSRRPRRRPPGYRESLSPACTSFGPHRRRAGPSRNRPCPGSRCAPSPFDPAGYTPDSGSSGSRPLLWPSCSMGTPILSSRLRWRLASGVSSEYFTCRPPVPAPAAGEEDGQVGTRRGSCCRPCPRHRRSSSGRAACRLRPACWRAGRRRPRRAARGTG